MESGGRREIREEMDGRREGELGKEGGRESCICMCMCMDVLCGLDVRVKE